MNFETIKNVKGIPGFFSTALQNDNTIKKYIK